jgi:S-formylglutathione hydrolase FrmB
MYSYVTEELPALLSSCEDNKYRINTSLMSLSGHSMGGHGALTIAFKNPDKYASVSAFAPIVDPANCPWGTKAFNGYLEGGVEEGKSLYSAVELLKASGSGFNATLGEILVDQGASDEVIHLFIFHG